MKLEIPRVENVILFGGGTLLVSVAQWCVSEGISVRVVTAPRHATELISPDFTLEDILDRERIEFLITDTVNSETLGTFFEDWSQPLCLCMSSAWIFSDEVIRSVFQDRLLNLHGTRLPQNRGGGGFSWQILMGNRLGFCQLHLVEDGIDTGDIVRTREFVYSPVCRRPIDFEERYQSENLSFIAEFIREVRHNGICVETTKQQEYFSTYWPRLDTSIDGWIDWQENPNSLERFICAFDEPYEGAKTLWNDKKVYIKEVCVDYSDPSFHEFQSGIIFRKNSEWVSVCTTIGTLIVQSVRDADGKNLLPYLNVGDRFYTPLELLADRVKRKFYTPRGKRLLG